MRWRPPGKPSRWYVGGSVRHHPLDRDAGRRPEALGAGIEGERRPETAPDECRAVERGAALLLAYNSPMIRRSLLWLAASAAALTALGVPYLLAYRGQPASHVFSGFLVNPIDGFSYFAKMRQGFDGAWLFQLPYTDNPGPGTFLFVYYLLLGHVERILGADRGLVYHAARLLGASLMFAAAYALFQRALPGDRMRRWAFGLVLFGSGLGWLGAVVGRLTIDLWVPEAIPFFAGYANAHFALASAALIVGLLAVGCDRLSRPTRLAWAVISGIVLALVQPFALITVLAVASVWLLWMRARPADGFAPDAWRERAGVLGSFLLASAPFLVYDAYVTSSIPQLSAWSAQNRTPTPPLVDVLLGLGIPLLLAGYGAWISRADSSAARRLFLVWVGVTLVLVFFPIPLQRRMFLGIFFPLAGLAGVALDRIGSGQARSPRWLAYVLFALCLPTNLVVTAATVGGAARQEPEVVLSADEAEAYRWVRDSIPTGSVVLAGDISGNRLPAFAPVRVMYGHPFETPEAERSLAFVEGLLGSSGAEQDVLEALRERSVEYVFVGDRERDLGPLTWLADLLPVYEQGGVIIYQVPFP